MKVLHECLSVFDIKELSNVIITHPHADHMGGLKMCIRDSADADIQKAVEDKDYKFVGIEK